MTMNYICDMKKYPVLIQISFHSDESYMERYLLIVELVNGEAKIVHLVNVPQWLVYHSKECKYHPINRN